MSLEGQGSYEFGPFRLDPVQQQLFENDKPVSLTPKAFDTLRVLVENHGRLVSKEELLEKVWPDAFVEEATLAQNVFRLRKLLEDGNGHPIYIETIPKRGYRFVAPVHREETSASALSRESMSREPMIDGGPQAHGRQTTRTATWRAWTAGMLAFILIGTAGIVYWMSRRTALRALPKAERVMLVVLPVQNLTGDRR